VITRTDQVEDLASIRAAVERFARAAPIFSSRMVTSGIRKLDGQSVDKESFFSRPLGAFCGVGNPESFFNHLRREQCEPAFTRAFTDHHNYRQSELDALVNEAKARGAEGLITTAKDAIKLSTLNLELPCYALDIQISIDEEGLFVKMIRDITYQNREQ
jgi:tetraacyldisaccharide 4'-kinase